MTEKQQEKIRTIIREIKAALAADKKRWGGFYNDSRGLRYAPPALYLKLGDYSGGLRYLNWFKKNFPDDIGFPNFLFEWTIILFKSGKLKEAEQKAFQTFCSNTYLFDKYFNKEIQPIVKWEGSNLETVDYAENSFHYHSSQNNLMDFSEWLQVYLQSEKFISKSQKLIEINKLLKDEKDRDRRVFLRQQAEQLESTLY